MRITFQHLSEHAAIAFEKSLCRAEYRGNDIGRDIATVQFLQVVAPKFVFDENCSFHIDSIQKAAHIRRKVKRKIANHVGQLIVLAHLIARRREERKQYLLFRMTAFQHFNQRTSLLEFAQRRHMNPHIFGIAVDVFLQDAERACLSRNHQFRLPVAHGSHTHSRCIKRYRSIIDDVHLAIIELI